MGRGLPRPSWQKRQLAWPGVAADVSRPDMAMPILGRRDRHLVRNQPCFNSTFSKLSMIAGA
jgi:hypothetical protein